MPRSIDDQVKKTYFSLRLSAAIIAFSFPLFLWIGGLQAGFKLRDSMSAYYHATPTSLKASQLACAPETPMEKPIYPQAGIMRNWFVGFLFAIGAILHANKGQTEIENWVLSVAGLFAVGIAVFPMEWRCKSYSSFSMHGTCAMAFFACIAFVSVVCSRDTVAYLNEKRRRFYSRLYWIWGALMVVAPIMAYGLNKWGFRTDNQIYWAEFAGIYAFGLYWVTKSFEIKEIQREQQAKPSVETLSRLTIA